MVEAIAASTLALIGGGYTVLSALHRRVSGVDNRLDRIELNLARDYVTRSEFMANQTKIEEHMIRIEKKLDVFIQEYSKR